MKPQWEKEPQMLPALVSVLSGRPQTLSQGPPLPSMHILCHPVTLRLALPGWLQGQRLYPQTEQVQVFMSGQQQGTAQAAGTWAPGQPWACPASQPSWPARSSVRLLSHPTEPM